MPRIIRKKSQTNIYHIVIKGADRQLLFEEKKDYIKYLDLLEYYKEKCGFELFAYCLMSNHVHLLLRICDVPLANVFRRLNTAYACWFNQKYDRTGFVQDSRYHSEPVESFDYLLTVIHYIHRNPMKAGLEAFPGEKYPWSSFREYQSEINQLADTAYISGIFGKENILNHTIESDDEVNCLDIQSIRKRLPDDVARDFIYEITSCRTATEFQKMSTLKRNRSIIKLNEKGVSIRQLNRLTGTPRGVIQRILTPTHTTYSK